MHILHRGTLVFELHPCASTASRTDSVLVTRLRPPEPRTSDTIRRDRVHCNRSDHDTHVAVATARRERLFWTHGSSLHAFA